MTHLCDYFSYVERMNNSKGKLTIYLTCEVCEWNNKYLFTLPMQ